MPFIVKSGSVEQNFMTRKGEQIHPRAYVNGYAPGPVRIEYETIVPTDKDVWAGKQTSGKAVRRTAKTARDKRVLGPRPTRIFGCVVPTVVSSGGQRGTTPEPFAGWAVQGDADVNRGHLMALELGGPNSAPNIAPQWGYWQRAEQWREMERHVENFARNLFDSQALKADVAPQDFVTFDVVVEYAKLPTPKYKPSLRRWTFPIAFHVVAIKTNAQGDHLGDVFRGSLEGGPQGWAAEKASLPPISYTVDHDPLVLYDDEGPEGEDPDESDPELRGLNKNARKIKLKARQAAARREMVHGKELKEADDEDEEDDPTFEPDFDDERPDDHELPADIAPDDDVDPPDPKKQKTERNSTPVTAQVDDKKADDIQPENQ